jgi:cell division protease FtsH
MIFGDITTGAQNDLETATKIARQMVCEYGMSDTLGPLTLGQKQDQVFLGRDFASHPDYSEQIAFEIDKEIRRIVDGAYNKAHDILEEYRDKMDLLAKELMEKETLSREEVLQLLSGEGASAEAEPQKGQAERQQERPEERVRPRRERKLIKPEPVVE